MTECRQPSIDNAVDVTATDRVAVDTVEAGPSLRCDYEAVSNEGGRGIVMYQSKTKLIVLFPGPVELCARRRGAVIRCPRGAMALARNS